MPTTPTHLKPSPMAVVVDHHHNFKPWKRRRRLCSFPHPDPSLLDVAIPSSSRDGSFHRSVSTPCFSTAAASEERHPDNVARVEVLGSCRSCGVHSLVVEAAIALASGAVPVPASSGLGGAYFLRSHRSGECFAVVKPIDQEPLALGAIDRLGSRLSVRAGETGLREVAAYLLDHGGFSSVPPTALIKISHPALQAAALTDVSDTTLPPQRRIASIQRFVPHDFDAGDLGPSRFSVASIHRIGILDVRLLNIDRHAGNLLVRKHGPNVGNDSMAGVLVPIDHGLCLPELLDDPYFEWLHWPQAAVPFSDPEAEYISSLDPFKDAELLHSELPSLRESAVRILILCTIFLKRAAASELCLAEIGGMMTREFYGFEEEPSVLELLCKRAQDSLNSLNRSSMLSDGSASENDDDEDDPKEFQFEMDSCGGGGGGGGGEEEFSEKCMQEVLGVPLLLRGKGDHGGEQRKVLGIVNEEEEGSADGVLKLGSTICKSLSLSAADLNAYECGGHGGRGKCSISFKGMSEEQWRLFLERFEQLLPEAFEARKSMGGGLKHRLGTSCNFF